MVTDPRGAARGHADARLDEVDSLDGGDEGRVGVAASRVHHLDGERNHGVDVRVTGVADELEHNLRRCTSQRQCQCPTYIYMYIVIHRFVL